MGAGFISPSTEFSVPEMDLSVTEWWSVRQWEFKLRISSHTETRGRRRSRTSSVLLREMCIVKEFEVGDHAVLKCHQHDSAPDAHRRAKIDIVVQHRLLTGAERHMHRQTLKKSQKLLGGLKYRFLPSQVRKRPNKLHVRMQVLARLPQSLFPVVDPWPAAIQDTFRYLIVKVF